jgi:acetylornithine deacetylase/succinyl-diaminopimelate desuccinylase-like protein
MIRTTIAETPAPATARQEVARIAALSRVHEAFAWFRGHARELSDWQLELTRRPAPPFQEHKRAEWLQEEFKSLGLDDVHIDDVGNVIGVLRGARPNEKAVGVTAHIDTVFPPGTKLNVRREGEKLYGPGISDNGAGVTAMYAVAAVMKATGVQPERSIVFIGNVGEEGEGDLRGMRHLFGESRYKDTFAHMLVLDGSVTDTIVTQGLGSRRLEVTVRGPGGHSWSDYGTANPIVILARALTRLSELQLPSESKTTLNIGTIEGGTSVNSIPAAASARIDIRSAAPGNIAQVEQQARIIIEQTVKDTTGKGAPQISHEVKLIGDRPAAELAKDSRILQVMQAVDAQLNNNSRIQRASTDANIPISMGLEAVSIGTGGTGGGAHSLNEWYDPTNRDAGLKRVLLAVLTLAGVAE